MCGPMGESPPPMHGCGGIVLILTSSFLLLIVFSIVLSFLFSIDSVERFVFKLIKKTMFQKNIIIEREKEGETASVEGNFKYRYQYGDI